MAGIPQLLLMANYGSLREIELPSTMIGKSFAHQLKCNLGDGTVDEQLNELVMVGNVPCQGIRNRNFPMSTSRWK